MKIMIDYIVHVNNAGLVFFEVQENNIYTNNDLVDIKEDSILFKKNENEIVFSNIKKSIIDAIKTDGGFDLYETNIDLEPVNYHRYGEKHKIKSKLRK